MKKLIALTVLLICAYGQAAYAASSCQSGDPRVLQAIPPIAKVFAPLAGANWQNFAQDLAGICAVESVCNPNTKHYLQGGVYSQYQGLYQMNMYEVAKAENYLNQVYPQLQQLAQSGQIPQDAWTFFQQAVQAGRSSNGDRRFLPEYGVILGAAKHIQIQKRLETQYPGDPLRQAAGHMVAQFSGIAESQIAAGNFNAPITGAPGNAGTEAGALSVNKVSGMNLAGAIESAGATYGSCMSAMMTQMSQVTGGLTNVPKVIAPFNAPPYQPGNGPVLSLPYSGLSTLMEMGMLPQQIAPPIVPSSGFLPALNPAAPQYTQSSVQTAPNAGNSITTAQPSLGTSTSTSSCSPRYFCSNNTAYYQSNSCSTRVFEMCQFGCLGTICAPATTTSSTPTTASTQTANSGGSALEITNIMGTQAFATSSFPGGAISSLLGSSISTIIQGLEPTPAIATETSYMTAENPALGYVTIAPGGSGQTYAASSPLFGLLDQLKTVLSGLIMYLRSL